MSAHHPFLAVAGSIGSGKTTLTRCLASRLEVRGLYESTDANPYLADFYADMPRYSLALQLRFLALRVGETREVQRFGLSAVQDRTCYEDADIFAANLHGRGDMDDRDWETYRLVADQLLAGLEPPDLLVYLARSPAGCLAQIQKRGREYEQRMPRDYLEDLGARYDAWFAAYDRGPKMLVRGEDHDFLGDPRDLERLVGRIVDALPQTRLPFASER
jgi:deoxyadenosine/deoxycytidine kinase